MTFLFLGDSITDCNHLWLPETNGLGNGFVSFLAEQIHAADPNIKILNKGADGFTTAALLQRIVSFVRSCHPQVICLLIGINDIGLAVHTGAIRFLHSKEASVPYPEPNSLSRFEMEFKKNYGQLLDSLRFLTDARILCIAPFLFPVPQRHLLQMPLIHSCEEIIHTLADAHQADFLNTQEYFLSLGMPESASSSNWEKLTTDGVHLTAYGHKLLADRIRPFLEHYLSFG